MFSVKINICKRKLSCSSTLFMRNNYKSNNRKALRRQIFFASIRRKNAFSNRVIGAPLKSHVYNMGHVALDELRKGISNKIAPAICRTLLFIEVISTRFRGAFLAREFLQMTEVYFVYFSFLRVLWNTAYFAAMIPLVRLNCKPISCISIETARAMYSVHNRPKNI